MNKANNLGSYAIKGKSPLIGKQRPDVWKKISLALKGNPKIVGKHNSPKTEFKKGILSTPKPFKKGQVAWNKGMKGYNSGEHSHFWKGGITKETRLLRASLENRLWRDSVFERDNYTCVWCGQTGGRLEADHIERWCERPDLRFAIDNGRTLCKCCHKKRHTLVKNYKL